MNTLNNANNSFAVTALYARLSQDDIIDGESNSITNQVVTALYARFSHNDSDDESNSIANQVVICKGGILPPNTYYDCGSFVVNRKAVIGKEKKSLVTAENSVQNGAVAYNRKLKPALWTI